MKATAPLQVPRPFWWRLLRVCALMLLVLMMPLIAFVIWNQIDEAPTPLADRYAASSSRVVADVDNAWLAFAGIGAAPEDDPIALGRRRVDAYNVSYATQTVALADAAQGEILEDAVVMVKPDVDAGQSDAWCPARDVDCLQWASSHADLLGRLGEANALRLQRFENLIRLRGWQVLYPPASEVPFVDTSISTLQMHLIALELARADSPARDPAGQDPLAQLAAIVEFWQRVRSEPQDLLTILASGKHIERAYWIAGAWLDHASNEQIATHAQSLDRLLAPAPAAVDWEQAMRNEYQVSKRVLAEGLPGLLVVARQCPFGSLKEGCFKTLAMESAYAPQATLNLRAKVIHQMQRILEASPQELEAITAEAGTIMSSTFPQFEDAGILLRQLSYNFAGRILAAISIPAFDWGRRELDREALRRMVAIKRDARLQGVDANGMVAYMQTLHSDFWNPLTGQPFEWDSELRTMHFAPLAEQDWKRPRVELSYADARRY